MSSTRLECVLAVAFRRRLSPDQLVTIIEAASLSRRGEQALANFQLATSRLLRIPDAENVDRRLELTGILLDGGMAAEDLLEKLQIRSPFRALLSKYSQDEARVPAGNGRASGRFGTGTGVRPALLAAAPPSLLASTVGTVTLKALATLATAATGIVAVLGVIFVPWQRSSTTSGSLPGGLTFQFDEAGGRVQIKNDAGQIIVTGLRDRNGIFNDSKSNVPFARWVGNAVMFVPAAISKPSRDLNEAPRSGATPSRDDDHPKLCPEPSTEKNNDAKKRARLYQEQISALINPQRPLEYGLAMAFFNPVSGKWVNADECDEADGSVIEAKGPGYAGLLTFPEGRISIERDWRRQGVAQVQAAGPRRVRWYFAEDEAADYAKKLFSESLELRRIEVNTVRARMQ